MINIFPPLSCLVNKFFLRCIRVIFKKQLATCNSEEQVQTQKKKVKSWLKTIFSTKIPETYGKEIPFN